MPIGVREATANVVAGTRRTVDRPPPAGAPCPRTAMRNIILMLLVLAGGGSGLSAAEPAVVFEDKFDAKLAEGWTWLREHPSHWRLRDGALEIHVEPGDANSVMNALVRPAPDRRQGTYAVEVTVRNHRVPTRQFEQAGITWYHDGKPVFKLVKELVDGQLMIIPGRPPMTNDAVQLRLVVTADTFTAQYRPDGQGEFQTAATGKLPLPGNDQVSLQCYHGPTDAEHWIRFDDFRILRLSE